MSVNKWIGIGNLGKDCDLRYTKDGTAVATLSMATTDIWTDKQGEKQEKATWHRIVIWGKMAENLAQYLVKGKQIYVEGQIQMREYEAKDGTKQKITEIRSNRITLLGGGKPKAEAAPPVSSDNDDVNEDDIPF